MLAVLRTTLLLSLVALLLAIPSDAQNPTLIFCRATAADPVYTEGGLEECSQDLSGHVRTVSAGGGGAVTANQGTPAVQANRWPFFWSNGVSERGTPADPISVAGSVTLGAGSRTLVDQGAAANAFGAWPMKITDGVRIAQVTPFGALLTENHTTQAVAFAAPPTVVIGRRSATYVTRSDTSQAATAGTALFHLGLFHTAGGQQLTLRITSVVVQILSNSLADPDLQVFLARCTTFTGGVTLVNPPLDSGDPTAEALVRQLPTCTSSFTNARLLVQSFNLGIVGTTTTHPLTETLLYRFDPTTDEKPPTVRPGINDGLAVGILTTVNTTVRLATTVIFTEGAL